MSESLPPSTSNGDDVPPWMKSLSEDALYDAEDGDASDEADAQRASTTEDAPAPSVNKPSATPPPSDDSQPLRRKLELSMADAPDIPEPNPDLQPTSPGTVRADLDRQLEKAVAVLQSRYATKVSRTLVLEFALQQTLRALREDGDESGLVQWLDSVLSPL